MVVSRIRLTADQEADKVGYPPVEVQDLTTHLRDESDSPEWAGAIKKAMMEPGVELGDPQLEQVFNGLLRGIRTQTQHVYLLVWEGSKIPRGATLPHNNSVIAWTQNGMVTDDSARNVGTYARIMEFGGGSGQKQVMLIFTLD